MFNVGFLLRHCVSFVSTFCEFCEPISIDLPAQKINALTKFSNSLTKFAQSSDRIFNILNAVL